MIGLTCVFVAGCVSGAVTLGIHGRQLTDHEQSIADVSVARTEDHDRIICVERDMAAIGPNIARNSVQLEQQGETLGEIKIALGQINTKLNNP